MGKRVLVLGGGVGGVVGARQLRRRLPDRHEVVLVERSPDHLFQPSLLWIVTGDRRPRQIRRSLAVLERKGIRVVQAEVEGLDPSNRSVEAGGRRLTGDALVIALGVELRPDLVPGLAEAGHDLYSLEGALAFREALRRFDGGRIIVVTTEPAYKCPAAPYEAALLVEAELQEMGVRERASLSMIAAEPGPMGVAGPDVSAHVRELLESRGIDYQPDRRVTAVDRAPDRLLLADGAEEPFDLLLYVPPHRSPGVVRASGLTDESDRVPVDRRLLATSVPAVFAVGDVTRIPLKMGKPLPMAGVFAAAQAEVVARNLAAEWAGRDGTAAFDGHGACFVETGHGRAAFGHGNFFADPVPEVRLHPPRPWWHWVKVLWEKYWLRRWL